MECALHQNKVQGQKWKVAKCNCIVMQCTILFIQRRMHSRPRVVHFATFHFWPCTLVWCNAHSMTENLNSWGIILRGINTLSNDAKHSKWLCHNKRDIINQTWAAYLFMRGLDYVKIKLYNTKDWFLIQQLYETLCRGVVVEWIRRRTVDHKVRCSSPATALMSFGKTLIYICHTQPRWCKWVPGRN